MTEFTVIYNFVSNTNFINKNIYGPRMVRFFLVNKRNKSMELIRFGRNLAKIVWTEF
jgi:hypothetical protein